MVQEIDLTCPVEFFAKLSDYGRKKHCCLLESRDYLTEGDAGELTFGTANPALYLTGTASRFTIEALSPTGRRMIAYFSEHRERFAFCKSVEFADSASRAAWKCRRNHGRGGPAQKHQPDGRAPRGGASPLNWPASPSASPAGCWGPSATISSTSSKSSRPTSTTFSATRTMSCTSPTTSS
jgi:hypothetical protein